MVSSPPSQGGNIGSTPLGNILVRYSNKKNNPPFYPKVKILTSVKIKIQGENNMAQIMLNSIRFNASASVCPSVDTLKGYHQPYIFKPIYH